VATIREGKAECKLALQQRCQLEQTQQKAIVGVVTRLTTQKGIHLIKHAVYRALERGCQVQATPLTPLSCAFANLRSPRLHVAFRNVYRWFYSGRRRMRRCRRTSNG
jgi:glycogen synthase